LHPIARGLSPEGHCDVLMSDDLGFRTDSLAGRDRNVASAST
jgi:hypothetical protein